MKLVVSLLSPICVLLLSVPVCADLVWTPPETAVAELDAMATPPEANVPFPTAVLVAACGIVVAGLVLFFAMWKRKR